MTATPHERRHLGGSSPVTRVELEQYQLRIEDKFQAILERLEKLDGRVGATGRWIRERLTVLVDGLLGKTAAAAAGGAAVFVALHLL